MRKLHSRWLWAALIQAALTVSAVYAQTSSVQTLPETVVTASRMPQDPTLLPQGVVVISADDIQAAGMTTANEAIRWLGGVVGRIDTTGSRDQTLDLRGFGETAGSNLVILVDGVRQNEGDMTGTALGWIPVTSIERIEIVRGSSSVLYGEGATAGAGRGRAAASALSSATPPSSGLRLMRLPRSPGALGAPRAATVCGGGPHSARGSAPPPPTPPPPLPPPRARMKKRSASGSSPGMEAKRHTPEGRRRSTLWYRHLSTASWPP
jgi:hypothetical protein